MSWSRQWLYATLIFLGGSFLFFRTIMMMTQDALVWMVPSVAALLLAESVLDAAILLGAVRWWVTQAERDIKRKFRILKYGEESGNVAKTCRYFGISRSTFYV